MKNTVIQFEPDAIQFKCPECSAVVIAGRLLSGGFAITHVTPMCSKFRLMPPDDFLAYCRKEYAKTAPN